MTDKFNSDQDPRVPNRKLKSDQIPQDQAAEDHLDDDDFQFDAEMREIESQLRADAEHLIDLFPVRHTSNLDALINNCLEAVPAKRETQATVKLSSKPSAGSQKQWKNWYKWPTVTCVALFVLAGSIWLWEDAGQTGTVGENPAVSELGKQENSPPPTMSLDGLPTQILNASQPELEAMYDEMGYFTVSVEF